MMQSNNNISIIDQDKLLQEIWLQSSAKLQHMTLFKTSHTQFFYNHGAVQSISPELTHHLEQSIVITIVASDFTYQNLWRVLQQLQMQKLPLITIKTLAIAPVAIEIYCEVPQGVQLLDQAWWQSWLDLSNTMHADIGVKPASHQGKRVRLACFDMDSTLIQAEVIDELAAEAGCIQEVSAITESAMRGELDFQQSFTKRLSMLQGLSESAITTVMNRIPFMDGAEQLFQYLNKQGVYTVILSGGFNVFAHHLQKHFNIKEVHANVLSIEDGALTGQAVLPIMDAECKQATLKTLAQKLHIPLTQTLAVGDGANDLMMLESAGVGIAFRAKPKVQSTARIAIRYGDLSIVPFFLGLIPS